MAAGFCGDHDVELTSRTEWEQRTQLPRAVERRSQLLHEPPLRLLGAVALAQGLRQLVDVQPKLELGDDLTPKRVERGLLPRGEHPRNAIEHAETAERVAVMRDQWRPGVEAHPGIADHERVLAEAVIGQRIGNHKQVVLLNRVRTERDAARGLRQAGPHP